MFKTNTAILQQGAEWIRSGGVVAFPTETVYGLGADALDPVAVRRLFEIKQRPLNNPLIVHVASPQQARSLVKVWPNAAEKLVRNFWPGPLTLVLKKSREIPDLVTAGNDTVGIRMPANPLALELIRRAGTPVAAPSANRFGCTSPTTANHVKSQLEGGYDFLIDGGACRVGVESTVISLAGTPPKLLRPGGVLAEEIEAIIGSIQIGVDSGQKQLESPGLLPSHYAPQTPLEVCEDIPAEYAAAENIGWLLLNTPRQPPAGPVEVLSEQGCLTEAAANLYAALRRLDAMNIRRIITHEFPRQGLGVAINDRLKRASKKEEKPTRKHAVQI